MRGRSGVGAGAGPKSAETVYRRWVASSSSMVRAPCLVVTLATTVYLSGESSWITVSVPSPFEAKARRLAASNRHASTPRPIGTVVTSFPARASEIPMRPLRQPLNSRWFRRSIARPLGDWQGAMDQCRVTFRARASTSTTSLLSSRFTYNMPLPALTPNSGFPPRSTAPTRCPDTGSIAVADPASPFMVKMRLEAGS